MKKHLYILLISLFLSSLVLAQNPCVRPSDCNDMNECTDEECVNGICVVTPKLCNQGTPPPCTNPVCRPTHGCIMEPIICPPMTDQCLNGTCQPGKGCIYPPVTCPTTSTSQCVQPVCNPETGECSNVPVDCDDGNACTADSCDPSTGCTHTTVSCNDNSLCTIDTCHPTEGCKYTTVVCTDMNSCTSDGCDPATGCTYNEGTCSDDTINCGVVSCSTGDCVNDYSNPLPYYCVDSNPCTIDTCVPGQGCVNTINPCDDSNACTNDLCVVTGETGNCVHNPITCDDGNDCTTDSCDTETGCVYTDIVCGNTLTENFCKIPFCNPEKGCNSTDVVCDMHNQCSTPSCDPAIGCVYTPIVCDDHNDCTLDFCSPTAGCQSRPVSCPVPPCICPKDLICIADEHLCVPPGKKDDCLSCINPETECALGYECKEGEDGGYFCKKIQKCLTCEDILCFGEFVCDFVDNFVDSKCPKIPHCRPI